MNGRVNRKWKQAPSVVPACKDRLAERSVLAGLPLREHTRLAESTIRLMTWMKLAVVGLAEFGSLSPQALSGGMKKRAAVARALSLDPEFLKEDAKLVSDTVLAAVQDAAKQAKEVNDSEMQKVTSAFQMPGIF